MNITLNKKEEKEFNRFKKQHKDCYCGFAIGGQFSLIPKFTGVGVVFVVQCNFCKKKEDITDYGSW